MKKIAADKNYRMMKEASAFAFFPIFSWGALVIGSTIAAFAALWNEGGTKKIIKSITNDFRDEEAGELYKKWYRKLSETDLISGRGSFPAGDPMGGAFMREFIHKKWIANSKMSEKEFEGAFEKHYGESAMGITQFGLDNEGGWVGSFNAILALKKAQDAAKAEGKDWRTERPESSKKIAADKNYSMLKAAENAVLSNNRITMIRISILSMGIKEILGFMGIVGAAFGLGKWGGWIKDKWNSLTGKEKEDAGDQELVQHLIASLSAEELEDLYHEILAHREIEELVNSESIAPKGVNSRLKSVMEEISDKFEKEIINNNQEEIFMLNGKKIAADKNYEILNTKKIASNANYRMLKKAEELNYWVARARKEVPKHIAKLEKLIGTDHRLDSVKKMVAEGRGGALNGEKELAKLVQEALFVHISRNNPELHKTRVPMKGDPYTYAQWYTVMSIHGAGPDAQFPNLLKQFGANQPQPKPKTLEAMKAARTLVRAAHQL